ncbi:dehydrogenase [Alcaligenaceae bacterium]|nr:dehydrogenase [Alcaligenaceae bacterium]
MKPLVVSTDSIHPDAVARIQSVADFTVASVSDGLSDAHLRSDVIVVRNPLPARLFDAATRLKAVIRHGAGLDMIPMDAASGAGVVVANVPAVNANAVAEYAVGQVVNLSRRLSLMDATLRRGSWGPARAMADRGNELRGKTVAIVGVGAIGRRVASICAQGFQMRILGVHHSARQDPAGQIDYVPLRQALEQADFLVLSCPLTPDTEKLIGAAELALMKPSAFLINVARGKVVDNDALVDALARHRIAGAALDVFDPSPLPPGNRYADLENTCITPHVAGMTQESMRALSMSVASQIQDILSGGYPEHWVNTSARDAIEARWPSHYGRHGQ